MAIIRAFLVVSYRYGLLSQERAWPHHCWPLFENQSIYLSVPRHLTGCYCLALSQFLFPIICFLEKIMSAFNLFAVVSWIHMSSFHRKQKQPLKNLIDLLKCCSNIAELLCSTFCHSIERNVIPSPHKVIHSRGNSVIQLFILLKEGADMNSRDKHWLA